MTNKKRMRIYQQLRKDGKNEKAEKMKQIDDEQLQQAHKIKKKHHLCTYTDFYS